MAIEIVDFPSYKIVIFHSELLVYQRVVSVPDNLSGWWLTYPSEEYEFVSWNDYSQYMEKQKMFQTTNQLCI